METVYKSFIRNFKKRKTIYSITIGGFAISMAILLVIIAFIADEKSYNKSFAKIQHMYRIKSESNPYSVPKQALKIILDQVPEIESMCLFNANQMLLEYNNEKREALFLMATDSFPTIFSLHTISGSTEGALSSDNNLIITKDFAQKVFGSHSPLGKIVICEDKISREIVAVVENPPKNSSIQYDVIIKTNESPFNWTWCNSDVCYYMYYTALILHENSNTDTVSSKISDLLQQFYMYDNKKVTLQPYADIYYDTETPNDGHQHANVKMIELLSWIVLLIFILSVLNYINLSTACNMERLKEVCIRKISGAKNISIIGQFLGESYITCFIAIILAIAISPIISPVFSEIMEKEIALFPLMNNLKALGFIGAGFLLMGLIAGIYPAMAVSWYSPIQLSNNKTSHLRTGTRGIFSTLQFVATIVLITSLIFIGKQIDFVKTKDFGFNPELLLNVNLEGETRNHVEAISETLLQNPNIVSLSASNGIPFNIWSSGSGSFKVEGKTVSVQNVKHLPVSQTFLETFQIPVIMGRDFRSDDKNVCIINKNFYKELEWKNLNNKNVWDAKVIGVIDDIHFESLHTQIGKLQLQLKAPDEALRIISIRMSSINQHETLDYIKSVMSEIDPEIKLNYTFYNEKIQELYKEEDKQAAAIQVFALIAIFLSCLGLLGMVEFASIKRVKEIGIRKVNGAKISEILIMLNKDFSIWVLIAFVLACPIAYFMVQKWLQGFAYKTELSWWVFLAAGALTLLIALLTVTWHSIKTARRNPIESLRYE